jgi:hypothetical protein
VGTNSISPPDESCIAHGDKFTCVIDRDRLNRTGTIFDENGRPCWHYGPRTNPEGRSWGNPLNKPDFVFTNTEQNAELTIRRRSFVPSVFHILDGTQETGQIELQSVVGIKYRILLGDHASFTFRLPLFTVSFWGDTDGAPNIWIMVGPSKMQWNILLKPGTNNRELVVSLAFIHNQWWNYS